MQQIIYFFLRNKNFLLFLSLFLLSIFINFRSNSYTSSKIINSSNEVLGFIYNNTADIKNYFNLVNENPEAIIIGDMGSLFNFELLNKLFVDVMGGSQIIAMHKNRFWMAADGPRIDLGAFVSALEYASGKSAAIC